MTTEQMKLNELVFALDKFEQGQIILIKSGCVIAEDVQDNIDQLRAQIVEMQIAHA